MVGDNTNLARSPLLPLRHEQDDLFVCDIFDAVPKGDAASMEHPVFSLATKPDTKIRTYESADGKSFVKVTPSGSAPTALATERRACSTTARAARPRP